MQAYITLAREASKKLEAFLDQEQTVGFYSKLENRKANACNPKEISFLNSSFLVDSWSVKNTPISNDEPYSIMAVESIYTHPAGVFNPIPDAHPEMGKWWNPNNEAKHDKPGKAIGYMSQGGNWVVLYPATRRVAVGGVRHGIVRILNDFAGINNLFNNNFENFQYTKEGTNAPWIKPWQVVNKDHQEAIALPLHVKELDKYSADMNSEEKERFTSFNPHVRKMVLVALSKAKSHKEVFDSLRKMAKVDNYRRSRIGGFISKNTDVETLPALKLLFGIRLATEQMALLTKEAPIYKAKVVKKQHKKDQPHLSAQDNQQVTSNIKPEIEVSVPIDVPKGPVVNSSPQFTGYGIIDTSTPSPEVTEKPMNNIKTVGLSRLSVLADIRERVTNILRPIEENDYVKTYNDHNLDLDVVINSALNADDCLERFSKVVEILEKEFSCFLSEYQAKFLFGDLSKMTWSDKKTLAINFLYPFSLKGKWTLGGAQASLCSIWGIVYTGPVIVEVATLTNFFSNEMFNRNCFLAKEKESQPMELNRAVLENLVQGIVERLQTTTPSMHQVTMAWNFFLAIRPYVKVEFVKAMLDSPFAAMGDETQVRLEKMYAFLLPFVPNLAVSFHHRYPKLFSLEVAKSSLWDKLNYKEGLLEGDPILDAHFVVGADFNRDFGQTVGMPHYVQPVAVSPQNSYTKDGQFHQNGEAIADAFKHSSNFSKTNEFLTKLKDLVVSNKELVESFEGSDFGSTMLFLAADKRIGKA